MRAVLLLALGHERPLLPSAETGVTPAAQAGLIGLDMLNPIQPEAMDIHFLKREYGRDLTLCGGLRTQDFLPLATPEEVRAEVRRLKEIMGAGGGFVLEPGITLQEDIPLANMVALFEEAMTNA